MRIQLNMTNYQGILISSQCFTVMQTMCVFQAFYNCSDVNR